METEARGRTLKKSFVEIMQGRILSGELQPGERLASERELAQELGISRGSVNQGILDLERMGFLRVVPRKGTFVAEFMENGTAETLTAIMSYDSKSVDAALFRDLMDFRILIERECVRLACGRMNTESQKLINERAAAIYSADASELPEAIYEFHRCMTKISGNFVYAISFQSYEKMLRNLIASHYSDRKERKKCLPLYDRLASAICRGDAQEADRELCGILRPASDYLSRKLGKQESRRGEENDKKDC